MRQLGYNVYEGKKLVATCKYPEHAAALCSTCGNGSTVRVGRSIILWNEGLEDFSAQESFDSAAKVIVERFNKLRFNKAALIAGAYHGHP